MRAKSCNDGASVFQCRVRRRDIVERVFAIGYCIAAPKVYCEAPVACVMTKVGDSASPEPFVLNRHDDAPWFDPLLTTRARVEVMVDQFRVDNERCLTRSATVSQTL
jgi:hypothetical protein